MSRLEKDSKSAPELDEKLDLPSGEGFSSVHVKVSLEQIFALSKRNLPKQFADPNYENERLKRKVTKEFVL